MDKADMHNYQYQKLIYELSLKIQRGSRNSCFTSFCKFIMHFQILLFIASVVYMSQIIELATKEERAQNLEDID